MFGGELGALRQVSSTQSSGEGELNLKVVSSVTGSRATRRSESFKQEVKVAAEKELWGVRGSVEVTIGFEQAREAEETLERTQGTEVGVTCKTSKGATELFQWRIDVGELCYVKDGGCQTSLNTLRTLCTNNRPVEKHPVCPPLHCADDFCTVCK